jgi:hypothetical protein
MLRTGPKSIFALAVVLTLCKCIDPYSPKLKGYESLLVVDGLVTDENKSYTVRLSRTLQDQNDTPPMVSDATVFITDNAGNYCYLNNTGDGIYKTDSSQFRGQTGRTYVLHINTPEGENYESDQCLMQSVPDIDSIYFAKDQEMVNNGTETREGIRIYLDSKGGVDNKYYRWEFEEVWQFKIPNPRKCIYINEHLIVPNGNSNEYCWKKTKSSEVLIHSVYSAENYRIEKEPIFFIATEKSDRLLLEYSILVRQYSISKNEYDFWDNLKKVNSSGEDIFAAQPFPVISNIHNINNPKERVPGFFQVSAIKQKRKDIPFSDIVGLNLPYYHYPCERIEREPKDYAFGFSPPPTWDELYAMFCVTSDYYFVEPRYKPGTFELEKLIFSRPECADCALTGILNKPDL